MRSLRSTTLPSPANPLNPETRARFIGSGNVAGGKPLGDIILGAIITAARRPGGLHETLKRKIITTNFYGERDEEYQI